MENPYREWKLADVLVEQDEQLLVLANAKAALASIQAELVSRYKVSFSTALAANKPDGSGTYKAPIEGVRVTGVADKKVSWDSDLLLPIAMSLPLAEAKAWFKFELSVSEKNWAAMPTELRARVEKARTVKVSDPKFSLEIAA
jgi:hypothetical protein